MLYNQFALTIAISVGLSGINSLTLSPALCAVFLRPETGKKNAFFRGFNRGFDALANGYASSVKSALQAVVSVLLVFAGLCALPSSCSGMPTGFVPEEDQGYVLLIVQLPEGATIERTEAVMAQAVGAGLQMPGVADVLEVSGYNVIDSLKQPYAGVCLRRAEPWEERKTPETQLNAIMASLQAKVAKSRAPGSWLPTRPRFPGWATGGFTFEIQDLNGQGVDALGKAVDQLHRRGP